MLMDPVSRRGFLAGLGAAGLVTAAGAQEAVAKPKTAEDEAQKASRARRMAWWKEARFGMFVHWGLYSVIGHQEWVLENEGIPIPQYEILAKHFKPKENAARDWARLAKKAGQKYIVMTTKHHEGFCLWDTKLTNYNAKQQGPGRDLVREFVEAARAEGLRVGFYYSLMDWHHPDGVKCKTDEAARARFVAYTHGLIRELMTNYGKIDVLWYDVDYPLTAEQWESERMNKMVFELQPEIIVNNRNGLEGDFTTPEQKIEASKDGRAWESCMTLNMGWGYQKNDDEWKSPRTIVNNLATCAQGGGNYLLNIGPKADGSVPEETVRILETVGTWMGTNGASIYGTEGGASLSAGNYQNFSRKGKMLYVHVYFWPEGTPAAQWLEFYKPQVVVAFGGLRVKALSAKVLKTGAKVEFVQSELGLRLTGLPEKAPDELVTVIEVACDEPPVVDHHAIRPEWKRYGVGVSA
jgi:alpha-L-fucosidase